MVVIGNDPTVKAGSWGARTVEKMIRMPEAAYAGAAPGVYLVDSAGARTPTRSTCSPGGGRRRIFTTRCGCPVGTAVLLLFGPSAAGGAYIPSFCDVVIMVEGRRLDVPGLARMAQWSSARTPPPGDGRRPDAL